VSGWWAAAFVVLWILVAVLAVVVVALARQIGVLQLRLAPIGALEVDDEGPHAAREGRGGQSERDGGLADTAFEGTDAEYVHEQIRYL